MKRSDVVVWGRRPPPVGGVTRCVHELSTVLEMRQVKHVVVDWREPARALAAATLERDAIHLHNVSSVWRLAMVLAAKMLSGATTIVYFHSGTLETQLRNPIRRWLARIAFGRVHAVWATNKALKSAIERLSSSPVHVVSPYSSIHPSRPTRNEMRNSIIQFVGYGNPLYGESVAYELMRALRPYGYTYTIVAYGDEESCRAVTDRARAHGMRALANLDTQAVADELDRHEILLRPTSVDGDAMIVREALDRGLRVVASNTVPRPAGVELAPLSTSEILRVILNGSDEISSGEGLGLPVADAVETELAHMRVD